MSTPTPARVAGALLILGAILVNIPYAMLISGFDYPDVLRFPPGEILERFAAGGPSLVWTWFAFAWTGLPILLGVLLLPKALRDDSATGQLALFFGAVGAVVQMVGLLRWTFVTPVLAQLYTDPASSAATKAAASAIFLAVHQYGGVVLGEHLGQAFTIVWMAALSLVLLRDRRFPRWFPATGFVAGGVYALAQGELFATVLPGFPVLGIAGLAGSLLWLAWVIGLGVLLLRLRTAPRA